MSLLFTQSSDFKTYRVHFFDKTMLPPFLAIFSKQHIKHTIYKYYYIFSTNCYVWYAKSTKSRFSVNIALENNGGFPAFFIEKQWYFFYFFEIIFIFCFLTCDCFSFKFVLGILSPTISSHFKYSFIELDWVRILCRYTDVVINSCFLILKYHKYHIWFVSYKISCNLRAKVKLHFYDM